MSRILSLALSAAAIAIAPCPATAESPQRTTVKELSGKGQSAIDQVALSELITGNTLRHVRLNGSQRLDMWYQAQGERIFYSGGANIGMRFQGWYRIKDGKRCELSTGGGEVCFTVHPQSEGSWYLCDAKGACDWVFRVEKGNPLGIE